MVAPDEQSFLHDCGARLYAQLQAMPISSSAERSRQARALVRDLLGPHQACATPILQVLDQLIVEQASAGVAEARVAAIQQQLLLTYNEATTLLVLSFARGLLQLPPPLTPGAAATVPLSATTPLASAAAIAAAAPPAATATPGPVMPSQPAATPGNPTAAPLGLVLFNQWLMLLTVLAGLGVITMVAIRALNKPDAAAPAASAPPRAPSATQPVPQPAAAPTIAAPTGTPPAPSSPAMYDAGTAVGGQRVLLDTASITAGSDPSRLRFRYWLGQDLVESEADCGRQTWTTYPEGQTHSPRSAATVRMLARVCQSAAGPAPSSLASSSGVALVIDPPSNIRRTPNGAILCSIRTRTSIPIQGQEGDWYRTDACGSPGYIHRGQVSF